jgi:hypothetical protein
MHSSGLVVMRFSNLGGGVCRSILPVGFKKKFFIFLAIFGAFRF